LARAAPFNHKKNERGNLSWNEKERGKRLDRTLKKIIVGNQEGKLVESKQKRGDIRHDNQKTKPKVPHIRKETREPDVLLTFFKEGGRRGSGAGTRSCSHVPERNRALYWKEGRGGADAADEKASRKRTV